jgi:hypothetical protein
MLLETRAWPLSKEDSTNFTSEGVFKFLLALRKRYDERRNKELLSRMRYLQNPEMK